MTDKVQKIKEFLMGMAGAACCDVKTKKNIETNILPFINSMQEKPVSEDLEEASKNYALNNTPWDDCRDEIQESFKAGAKWQEKQDQSTIELAEDHAMFAGMEKMKEEMMAKAIDAELYSDGMLTPIIKVNDKEKISNIKFGDEVKVIVIKKG